MSTLNISYMNISDEAELSTLICQEFIRNTDLYFRTTHNFQNRSPRKMPEIKDTKKKKDSYKGLCFTSKMYTAARFNLGSAKISSSLWDGYKSLKYQ